MKKTPLALFVFLFATIGLKAQHVINGIVRNSDTKKPVPVVSVIVKETADGDFTNDNGNFRFTTSKKFPLTIVFSSIGFEQQELLLSSPQNAINIELKPASSLGQEVVVSAVAAR